MMPGNSKWAAAVDRRWEPRRPGPLPAIATEFKDARKCIQSMQSDEASTLPSPPPPSPPMASSSNPAIAPSRDSRLPESARRTSRTPNLLALLPAELGIMVFQQVAVCSITDAASLTAFLNLRLVCSAVDKLIRSKQVAYAAVLAVNGNLLRDGSGKPLVDLADISGDSWWHVLLDQRRLDRVWLDGGRPSTGSPASTKIAPPGYEVLLLDLDPSHTNDTKLSQYDSPCADISSSLQNQPKGIIGYLAHRVFTRSTATNRIHSPHSITVHLLAYPALHEIANHVLMHRGFGSPETNCDLPISAPCSGSRSSDVVMLRTNDGPWTVALGHVDAREHMYSLMCTDSRGLTVVHLRSYAPALGDEASMGTTVASVCIPSHCYAISICLLPTASPPQLRLTYIHKSTRAVHILTLARTSLAHIAETAISHSKYYSHNYTPTTQWDLIALGPLAGGHIHMCNVHTGALVHKLRMPADLSVNGQKAHGATFRALLPPAQHGRRQSCAGQWMLEWTRGVRVRGDEEHAAVRAANACHVHVLAPNEQRVVAQLEVPPVQCTAVLGAHVYLVMSPNGDLAVVDLTAPEARAVGIWNVSAGFTRRVLGARRAVDEVKRVGLVQVTRVAPERVGRVMGREMRRRDEVERRNKVGRGERAERRNRVRDQMAELGGLQVVGRGCCQEESDQDEVGDGQDEEEDADDELWTEAGDMVMLGERGDAVLAVRGSVVTILRRCVSFP